MEGLRDFVTEEQFQTALDNFYTYSMTGFRATTDWADKLDRKLSEMKEAGICPDVIIFDNVSRIIEGDIISQKDVKIIHRLFKPIALKYNLAVLLISHTRKTNASSLQDISGSGDFGAQVTVAYISKFETETRDGVVLSIKKVKNNLGNPRGEPEKLVLTGTPEFLTLQADGILTNRPRPKYDECKTDLDTYLKTVTETTHKDIITVLTGKGHTRYMIDNVLREGNYKKANGMYGLI